MAGGSARSDRRGEGSSDPTADDGPLADRRTPLTPGDAVAAILVLEDGRYLLQHRDMKSGIFFPGHWGCFGGGVEPGEPAPQAVMRELEEELGLKLGASDPVYFTRFDFDLGFADCGRIYRMYYELPFAAADLGRIRLGEGQDVRAFSAEEILVSRVRLTPYDAFALWMHINRGRLIRP